MTQNSNLQSGVLTSPADALLACAISETLRAAVSDRARLFEKLVRDIERYMAALPEERPWTCVIYTGIDGSRIFRGGIGHSLVIDPTGRLWRARSYEDFETTYAFSEGTCTISTLTPLFEQMREYVPERERPPPCHPTYGTAQAARATHNRLRSSRCPVEPHVGTPFWLHAVDREVELRLNRAARVMESEAARLNRTPFSLFLVAPVLLPQQIYRLTHDGFAGPLDIFLVPVAHDASGFTYEAVFTWGGVQRMRK